MNKIVSFVAESRVMPPVPIWRVRSDASTVNATRSDPLTGVMVRRPDMAPRRGVMW